MGRQITTHHVAYRVRRLRAQRGWSAQQLADRCGDTLTRSTIAKIESGVRQTVKVEELEALAHAFGVDEAELLSPPTPAEELSDAVTSLRRSVELSTQQLAVKADVSPQVIALLGVGEQLPDWSTLRNVIEALGGDVAEFHSLWRRADTARHSEPLPQQTQQTSLRVVPQQLPPPSRSFVGRSDELARLDSMLDQLGEPGQGPVVCVISGIGGVGKTALAVTWAHRIRDRFPDGCLYVDLQGLDVEETTSPAAALDLFLFGLGVPGTAIPSDTRSMAALYRSIVADKRMLVVLDNARDAKQVAPLLPSGGECAAVITSRQQLPVLIADYGAIQVTLGALPLDEAIMLLEARFGASHVDEESAHVAELARLCAGLPLALNIVGAQVAMRLYPVAELVDRLGPTDNRLDALEVGDFDIRAALAASYQSLDGYSARLFRLLGLVPGTSFDRYDAAALCGVKPTEANALLERLLQASLVESSVPGRFHMHELLRLYSQDQVQEQDSDQDRRDALHRLLDYFLHTASVADRLLDSYWEPITLDPLVVGAVARDVADQDDAVTWFTGELDNLLPAIRIANTHGFHKHAWQLAAVLTTFMYRQVRWRQWTDMLNAAVDSASRLGDREALARINRILGTAYARRELYEQAQNAHEQALETFRQLGDLSSQAHTLLMLCRLFNWQRRHSKAKECAAEALRLYEEIDHPGRARAMIDLGRSYARLLEYEKASELANQALLLCQNNNDGDGECTALALLGDVHYDLGHYSFAVEDYSAALELWRAIGDRFQEAETLVRLADSLTNAGDVAASQNARSEAETLFDAIGLPQATQQRLRLAQ
ncbi:helix-turn-helix domain-containing protein [Nocardia australiensis]|uniref:helix-turn-helix domain-containing protein n=1 Tax=Nocardia australiensis TaxID=2887191 RepID=UPI001D13C0DA|nr:helix-turn-helix domain-containing protein [Nocardia australiensis]